MRRLESGLERRGRQAWVDWEGILPTEEWMEKHPLRDRCGARVLVRDQPGFGRLARLPRGARSRHQSAQAAHSIGIPGRGPARPASAARQASVHTVSRRRRLRAQARRAGRRAGSGPALDPEPYASGRCAPRNGRSGNATPAYCCAAARSSKPKPGCSPPVRNTDALPRRCKRNSSSPAAGAKSDVSASSWLRWRPHWSSPRPWPSSPSTNAGWPIRASWLPWRTWSCRTIRSGRCR